MKKCMAILTALVLTIAAEAQTLNVTVGNVVYQFPSSQTGDMTYNNGSTLTVMGKTYTERKDAGAALIKSCSDAKRLQETVPVGQYNGFDLSVSYNVYASVFELSVHGKGTYTVEMGADPVGNITRLNNMITSFGPRLEDAERRLSTLEEQLANAQQEVGKPFPQEQELIDKQARLSELNSLLNMDERGSEAAVIDEDADLEVPSEAKDKEERAASIEERDEPNHTMETARRRRSEPAL